MKIKMYLSNLLKLLVLGLIFNSAFAENPSKEELKRMSVFISNFTEARIGEIDMPTLAYSNNQNEKQEIIEQLVSFGIEHNYINNFQSRMANNSCPKKEHYAGIELKYLQESVDKYFGYNLSNNLPKNLHDDALILENNCYYRILADGEMVAHAKVNSVKKQKDGIVFMSGILYYPDMDNEFGGLFIAKAKEKTYKGKKTWELISLKIIN